MSDENSLFNQYMNQPDLDALYATKEQMHDVYQSAVESTNASEEEKNILLRRYVVAECAYDLRTDPRRASRLAHYETANLDELYQVVEQLKQIHDGVQQDPSAGFVDKMTMRDYYETANDIYSKRSNLRQVG